MWMHEYWMRDDQYCDEHESYKWESQTCECWALAESEHDERQFDQWIEDRAFGNL